MAKNKSDISIEHDGYKIVLSGDLWVCHDLDIEDASLAVVKRKVSEANRSDRRIDRPMLMLDRDVYGDRMPMISEVTLTVLVQPRYTYAGISEGWITQGKSRSKVSLSTLFETSERKALENYVQLAKAAKQAEQAAEKALSNIHHVNAAKLMKGKASGK